MTPQEVFEEEKARIDKLIGCDSCAKNRKRQTILGKVVLTYILHEKYGLSTTITGRLIGLDHSTVCHHYKHAKDVISYPNADKELYLLLTNE